jgi:hypothetical protein
VADSCSFLAGGPSVSGSVGMTNSIVVATGTQAAISIRPTDSTHTSEIINNTFVGGAIFCPDTAHARTFYSNIFYNSTTIETSSNCVYQHSLVWPSSSLSGTGNIMGDPQFVDPANGNFHLRSGSPAIDSANPERSTGKDQAGVVRPQGTRADIGAFEYVP